MWGNKCEQLHVPITPSVFFSPQSFITRLSFPIFTSSSPSRVISFMWIVTEKTEWERLHTKFNMLQEIIGEQHVQFLMHPSTWSRRSWGWRRFSSWLLLSLRSDILHLYCEPSPPLDPSQPRFAAKRTYLKSHMVIPRGRLMQLLQVTKII